MPTASEYHLAAAPRAEIVRGLRRQILTYTHRNLYVFVPLAATPDAAADLAAFRADLERFIARERPIAVLVWTNGSSRPPPQAIRDAIRLRISELEPALACQAALVESTGSRRMRS